MKFTHPKVPALPNPVPIFLALRVAPNPAQTRCCVQRPKPQDSGQRPSALRHGGLTPLAFIHRPVRTKVLNDGGVSANAAGGLERCSAIIIQAPVHRPHDEPGHARLCRSGVLVFPAFIALRDTAVDWVIGVLGVTLVVAVGLLAAWLDLNPLLAMAAIALTGVLMGAARPVVRYVQESFALRQQRADDKRRGKS